MSADDRGPEPPGTPGGDEDLAMLMAQHGALRYADVETVDRYLGRTRTGREDPSPDPGAGA